MNSSGIKRGLAVSAISALAVAGIPALASPASADPGDVIQVAFTGPALDGGGLGAEIVLKTKGIDDLAQAADLQVVNTALNDSANTPNQTIGDIDVVEYRDDAADNEFGGADGFDEIVVRIPVDVRTTGDAANFAIFLDDNNTAPGTDDTVQADEASAPVTVQTAGELAQIAVAPGNQTSAAGVPTGDYTVTLRDAAGRTTQLDTGESIAVTIAGANAASVGTVTEPTITAVEAARGVDTFRATGSDIDVYDITLTSSTTPTVTGRATLDVVRSAAVDRATEVDIVTAADDWNGFGNPGDTTPNVTFVRVDQSSIRIDIRSTDANADRNGTVTLNLTGTGITFGGRPDTTVSTVLDANGIGSLTITPDAGTVQVNDSIAVSGAFNQTLRFVRGGEAAAIQPGAQAYVSAIDGSVDVSVTVVDRFGQPVSSGIVAAARRTGGPNADTAATTQRKPVGADGTATFTFTDVNAVPGQSDTVDFLYFEDQFDNSGDFAASTQIRYTVDGQGRDFATRLEGRTASGTGYNPATNVVTPLSDGVVSDTVGGAGGPAANESIALEVVGAEPNTRLTVSVDNGALILRPGETRLAQGSASESVVLDGTGSLPTGWSIIGTKSGLVTVTVSAANRTETSQFTVSPQAYASQARNVSVSGPAEAVTGDQQVTYTAVVTDAFGNPVAGVTRSALNIQVSGPGQFQDSDVATNAAGQIALNVRLDDNAQGVVAITVSGIPGNGQFGAQADRVTAASTTNDGTGLPVSSNTATASTTVTIDDDDDTDPVKPVAKAKGSNRNTDGFDRVRIDVSPVDKTDGAAVELWKINAQGKARRVKTKALNDAGTVTWIRPDSNGKKVSRYFAKVRPTETSLQTRSNTVRIK